MKISRKWFVFICLAIMLLGMYLGFSIRLMQDYELISAMEFARDSHQNLLEHPEYLKFLSDVGIPDATAEEQIRWVNIYEKVIKALKY